MTNNLKRLVGTYGYSVSALMCLMTLAACTGNKASNSANNASSATLLNQSPLISCKVNNVSNGNASIMKVTNLTQASNYTTPPVAPAQVAFDCSSSTSSSGGPVTVSIAQNNGAFVPLTNNSLSQMYANPSLNTITVKAVDSKGLSSTVNFTLPVSCNPLNYPAISLNAAGISFTPGAGGVGYVNATVPAATGGSGGAFTYSLDLNGDGRFDDFNQQYWNPSTSFSNMYTLYSGTRTVSITAFDTKCQLEKTFTTTVDFSKILPAAQSGGTATQTGYYYLQGQVSSLSNSVDPADNVAPFEAVEAAVGTPTHVLCSYTNGQFNITGGNTYSDGNTSTTESLLKHGMQLDWTISDNGSAGSMSVNNVPVTNLVYQTAASPDGSYNQSTYIMNSSCTANVTVSRQTSVQPCTAGMNGSIAPTTTILGTYTCPQLTAAPVAPAVVSKAVSITNGYFYCQVAPTNNCVGGGGGGGQPPPQF